MDSNTSAYSWRPAPVFRTSLFYLKCGFYKTFIFSIFFYPLLVFFGKNKKEIKEKKNKILEKELSRYILRNYGIKVRRVEGGFAMGGLLEVFPKRFYDYFKVGEKDVVYDIGATVGEFSLKCAKKGSEVIALELEREAYLALLDNIEANKFDNKIQAFNCKVGEKKYSPDSFLKKTKKAPTLMKIDIEGDEVKALRGSKKILQNHKPKIILETHSKKLEDDCLRLLKDYGYKLEKEKVIGSKNKETKLLFLR